MGLVILLCQIMSLGESLDLPPVDKDLRCQMGYSSTIQTCTSKSFVSKKNSEFAQTVLIGGCSPSGLPIPNHPSIYRPRYQIASVLRATEEVLMVDSRLAVLVGIQ